MTIQIKLRRDTAANWASEDPTLALGEPGLDTTNRVLKIGDGSTAWSSLTGVDVDGDYAAKGTFPVLIGVALSDETTAITTGTAKATIHAPFAFTLTAVRAELATAATAGGNAATVVDINEGAGAGTTVLSTKLSIDQDEETSTTANTAAVISDAAIADAARITFDIDTAGTGAKGLKVWLIGTRVLA